MRKVSSTSLVLDQSLVDSHANQSFYLNRKIQQFGSSKAPPSQQAKKKTSNSKWDVSNLWDSTPQSDQKQRGNLREICENIETKFRKQPHSVIDNFAELENRVMNKLKEKTHKVNPEYYSFQKAQTPNDRLTQVSSCQYRSQKTGKFASCEEITECENRIATSSSAPEEEYNEPQEDTQLYTRRQDEYQIDLLLPSPILAEQMKDILLDEERQLGPLSYMQELQKLATIIMFRARTRI